MNRLELRTAERNEAMAATTAAEGRIKVSLVAWVCHALACHAGMQEALG